MFDQIIGFFISNKDVLIIATAAMMAIGIFAKLNIKRVMMYVALLYCACTTIILVFSDGATEIPVAEIMSQYKWGFIALVGLTVGIKAYCVASGVHSFDLQTKLFFNFAVIPYSVLISVAGQSVIYSDSDVKKDNIKQQIVSLDSEKSTLLRSLNGFPSCASQRWCDSQAKEKRVSEINAELSMLRKNNSASTKEALEPTAAMLSRLPFLNIDTATLLFLVAFLRTLVATYATMVMSRMTANLYFTLSEQNAPKKRTKCPSSADKMSRMSQKSGQKRTIRDKRQEIDRMSDNELVLWVAEWCQNGDKPIPASKVNREVVQDAIRAKRNIGIRATRADDIKRLYKKAVSEIGTKYPSYADFKRLV